jgi:hypothetical protein
MSNQEREAQHGPETRSPEDAKANSASARNARNVLIVVLVLVAFFAAYRFALASWTSSTASAASGGASDACCTTGAAVSSGATQTCADGSCSSKTSAVGGSCCATGAQGAPAANTSGGATQSSGAQRVSVEVTGGYNPSTIELKAGIPAEITFGQSSGCTAVVQSKDLGFREDLTSGPKTVKLPALKAGTYGFACGMDMVHGQIVVK